MAHRVSCCLHYATYNRRYLLNVRQQTQTRTMTKRKAAKRAPHPQIRPPKRAKGAVPATSEPERARISGGRKRGNAAGGTTVEREIASDHPGTTLKERVEKALNHGEPPPTAAESEAIRLAISIPGLLDEVREQAFVALAGVVERKLAEHGRHLTQSEAANVAWWIVGHPDDVPDA